MPISASFRPELSHATLGDAFFDVVAPARFPKHSLRFRNQRWARRVGLDTLDDAEWLRHFGAFEPLPGSFPAPLALRYHGHQFRTYNPDLGDGRGFLFAQLRDLKDGRLLDLGTKGSGQTPWSRTADGRLTLKGGLREILATEMLEALGIETSKTFSLIETGEELVRGDEPSPTRSSVLVRLNHSHIRIGTFQRLAYFGDTDNLRRLLHYVAEHYMPELAGLPDGAMASAFLAEVIRRTARMAAGWMVAGFVHGVLNSDNINVTGESFDYGPWRFTPTYDQGFTAAYFDQTGLYAFGRQPGAVAWNVSRLAECLLPFSDKETLGGILESFGPSLQQSFSAELLRRLGLQSAGESEDLALASDFVAFLISSKAGLEQSFFDWYGGHASTSRARRGPASQHYASDAFQPVLERFARFVPIAGLRLDHAYFARSEPCTMLIGEVESLWAPIAEGDDWTPFQLKCAAIAEMAEAYGTR